MHNKVSLLPSIIGEVHGQTFESNCFGPADIVFPIQYLPAWDESPGSPHIANSDCNSKLWACIWEHLGIVEGNRPRDSPCDGGLLKDSNPPLEVHLKSFRTGVWYEWTTMENPEHALQFGEVCLSHRNDQADMKEFTVELFHVPKCVHWLVKPLLHYLKEFFFLGHCQRDLVHFSVPVEPNVGCWASKLPVFWDFPWDAQSLWCGVNIFKVVCV